MHIRNRIAAFSLLAAALPAFAGGTATVESTGGHGPTQMKVGWSGKNMRMDFPGREGTYMLVREGNSYSVTNRGGQAMVMDMSAMGRMAESMGGQAGTEIGAQQAQSVESIEATGRSETVAGIEGEVYRIQWTDGAGSQHDDTAVLSGDPRAVGLTGAFRQFATTASGQSDPLGEALAERDLGILRFGEKFTVVSISDEAPPSGDFELPAEPMDMQKMMEGFSQGAGGR